MIPRRAKYKVFKLYKKMQYAKVMEAKYKRLKKRRRMLLKRIVSKYCHDCLTEEVDKIVKEIVEEYV